MNPMTDVVGRLMRGVFKLLLALALGVFVLSFLLAALVVVLGVSLWSVLTGRKPTPVVMFSRMREQSRRYTQSAQSVWPGRAPVGEVVDVDATVVGERDGAQTPLQRLR